MSSDRLVICRGAMRLTQLLIFVLCLVVAGLLCPAWFLDIHLGDQGGLCTVYASFSLSLCIPSILLTCYHRPRSFTRHRAPSFQVPSTGKRTSYGEVSCHPKPRKKPSVETSWDPPPVGAWASSQSLVLVVWQLLNVLKPLDVLNKSDAASAVQLQHLYISTGWARALHVVLHRPCERYYAPQYMWPMQCWMLTFCGHMCDKSRLSGELRGRKLQVWSRDWRKKKKRLRLWGGPWGGYRAIHCCRRISITSVLGLKLLKKFCSKVSHAAIAFFKF